MLQKIITNLPKDYPEWALKRVLVGDYLPSHSDEQIAWNTAIAKVAQVEAERLYFRANGNGNHIAAWNALCRANRYINSQQTKYFNDGQILAEAVIDNLKDALALEPGLEWPEPFPEVYRTRAFWSDQEMWDENHEGRLFRNAGDPRWFLEINREACPWYFLPRTLSRKGIIDFSVREFQNTGLHTPFDWAYEYVIRGKEGTRFAGEVSKKENGEIIWHIPRDLTEAELFWPEARAIRQGDKYFIAWEEIPRFFSLKISLIHHQSEQEPQKRAWNVPEKQTFGRHVPDPTPYGTGKLEYMCNDDQSSWNPWGLAEDETVFVFAKPPIIRHPEHPAIQLPGRYVQIKSVPGQNMYLGRSGPEHD